MFRLFYESHGLQFYRYKWLYRIMFREKGLKFGHPKGDTCTKCDKLEMRIKTLTDENDPNLDDEIFDLALEKEGHLSRADLSYTEVKLDRENSRQNPAEVVTIVVDLQGVLTSPKLSHSDFYYQRKFSTYNLGIHSEGGSYMFVWHQTEARRGCSEILSCIWRFIRTRFQPLQPNQRRVLNVWSDRCGGQNVNWQSVAFYGFLLDQQYFTEVQIIMPS